MHGFVEFCRLVEVQNVYVAVCSRYHEHCVFRVHAVNAFLAGYRSDGGRLSEIPVFHRFVPRAGHEDGSGLTGHIDEAYAADGLVMRGNLLSGGLAGGEVDHAGCFVGAGAYDFSAVLDDC